MGLFVCLFFDLFICLFIGETFQIFLEIHQQVGCSVFTNFLLLFLHSFCLTSRSWPGDCYQVPQWRAKRSCPAPTNSGCKWCWWHLSCGVSSPVPVLHVAALEALCIQLCHHGPGSEITLQHRTGDSRTGCAWSCSPLCPHLSAAVISGGK